MGDEPDDAGLSRGAIRKAIHESLTRLAPTTWTSTISTGPIPRTRIDETLAVMDELVREGKVRYPAISNYAAWQALEMLWKSDNRGYVPPTVSQPMYNVLARGIEHEYLPFCRQYGIGVVPYNPLAGGLLTGKHHFEAGPASGTRFDGNRMYQERYWHREYFEAVGKLKTPPTKRASRCWTWPSDGCSRSRSWTASFWVPRALISSSRTCMRAGSLRWTPTSCTSATPSGPHCGASPRDNPISTPWWTMTDFWAHAAAFVWGPFTVVLLMGTGLYLSFRLGWTHLRRFDLAWRLAARGSSADADRTTLGDISPWQSMMTMLAGRHRQRQHRRRSHRDRHGRPRAPSSGCGRAGLLAMATKYSEAVLGCLYRERLDDGATGGGPMYYLKIGARSPVLAWIFALLAGMAAMTTGPLAQTNSIALVLNTEFHIPRWVSGAAIAVAAWLVVIGGIRSIARFAEKLVPLKICLYVGGCLFVILTNFAAVPETIRLIFRHAFTPTAALGGFAGSSVLLAARLGAARGLYANEAGLGTAAMAYGAARSREPMRQGLIATVDVFIITFVTCTMSALVVTVSGQWSSGLTSTALVASAFNTRIPVVGGWIVAVSSLLFGYSNLVGWSYYGELCFRYIFSSRVIRPYAWIYCALIFVGRCLRGPDRLGLCRHDERSPDLSEPFRRPVSWPASRCPDKSSHRARRGGAIAPCSRLIRGWVSRGSQSYPTANVIAVPISTYHVNAIPVKYQTASIVTSPAAIPIIAPVSFALRVRTPSRKTPTMLP